VKENHCRVDKPWMIMMINVRLSNHRRYPYFDVVAGLVWSNDPESCADSRVATGRVSLAG
jgi:hypothetical protein